MSNVVAVVGLFELAQQQVWLGLFVELEVFDVVGWAVAFG